MDVPCNLHKANSLMLYLIANLALLTRGIHIALPESGAMHPAKVSSKKHMQGRLFTLVLHDPDGRTSAGTYLSQSTR